MSTDADSLAKNGDLAELLLGNQLVVSPPGSVPKERNVHPRVVVGTDHSRLFCLEEFVQDLPVLNLGSTSGQEHERRSPDLREEHWKAPLCVSVSVHWSVVMGCAGCNVVDHP